MMRNLEHASTLDSRVNQLASESIGAFSAQHSGYVHNEGRVPVLATPAAVAVGYAAVGYYAGAGAAFTAGVTVVSAAYTAGRAAG
jgi:hypothetical protein